MVANVLPLGCPLPQCQGERGIRIHPRRFDRALLPPTGGPGGSTAQDPREDSVQLVIAASSLSVTPCTYRYRCYSPCMTWRVDPEATVGLRAVDSVQDLLAADRAHVWHPYGPMPGRVDPLVVRSAAGVRLQLADGTELVDGMSSWWAAIHGYAHPVLDAAVQAQLGRMSHVMFGGLTHEPAVRLARRLVEITPEPLQHVFFTDSGSVSVEVAIKMCLQYWRSLRRPGKHRLLTWRGGYHGDTFGAMSVCDPEGGMHALWTDILASQVFVPPPPAQSGATARPELDVVYVQLLADTVARHADELAAVIIEPVVQGAGGMRFHDPRYLHVLREITLAHDVLLVFDEIATGFGRTGMLFAADHAGISPDVMCVGKALTGGYLTMAATLCTPRVADGISGGEVAVLAHGPTFMANPLAAAVASASIELLLGQDWRAEVRRLEAGLRAGLGRARELPGVIDVRVLGAIGVVQLDHQVDVGAATAAAVAHGVWLRPFRDLIYTMPPYITGNDDLARIIHGVVAAVAAG
jgi:adenosylmethionine---8-amino-7-oxononanoate aminotransferase